jgi:hypothetical protein
MNPPSILTVSRNSRRAVPKPRPLPLSSPPSPPPGRAFQRPRATVVMPSLNPDPCPCRPRHRPIAAAHASPSVVPRHRPCATAATPSRPRPLHLSSPPSATPASRNIRRTCQPGLAPAASVPGCCGRRRPIRISPSLRYKGSSSSAVLLDAAPPGSSGASVACPLVSSHRAVIFLCTLLPLPFQLPISEEGRIGLLLAMIFAGEGGSAGGRRHQFLAWLVFRFTIYVKLECSRYDWPTANP